MITHSMHMNYYDINWGMLNDENLANRNCWITSLQWKKLAFEVSLAKFETSIQINKLGIKKLQFFLTNVI